jgi:hypothetical protein
MIERKWQMPDLPSPATTKDPMFPVSLSTLPAFMIEGFVKLLFFNADTAR